MSKLSEIRVQRSIKRRLGRKRCTHHGMLNNATLQALKRIVREDGAKAMHKTAFSIEVTGASQRVREILRAEGFLELGPGNFVHKKARFSDLAVSAMSFDVVSIRMLPEFKFTQPDQFTLGLVSDIHLGGFNGERKFDDQRYRDSLAAAMKHGVPMDGDYVYEQRICTEALPEVDPADFARLHQAVQEQAAAATRATFYPGGNPPSGANRMANDHPCAEAKPFINGADN